MQLLKILQKRFSFTWGMIGVMVLGVLAAGCDHPVRPSGQPGVVKITLQHAPEDTVIEMAGQTNILTRQDAFPLTISEGRVVRSADSAFVNLFQNMDEYQQEDFTYNVLALERDNAPARQQIFETRIPPGEYTEISFVVNTTFIRLVPPEEQAISQPVQMGQNVVQPITIDADFTINEQQTTVINLRLASFESLTRFRDTFQFIPQISVHSIKQP